MFLLKFLLLLSFVFIYGVKGYYRSTEVCDYPRESVFYCDSGYCILKKKWCDKSNDCGDSSDEYQCPNSGYRRACKENHFKCHSQNMCIPRTGRCDGFISCPDGSDEKNCLCTSPGLKNGSIEKINLVGQYRTAYECWNFELYENEKLTVNIEHKLHLRECKFGNITLSIDDGSYFFMGQNQIEDSVYTICPVDRNKITFTFINDVRISYNSYFPFDEIESDKFKITYSIDTPQMSGPQPPSHPRGTTPAGQRSQRRAERERHPQNRRGPTARGSLINRKVAAVNQAALRASNPLETVSPDCLDPEMFMCTEISCVSLEKQCDGVKNCKNGFDEKNCGFVAFSGDFFQNSREKATTWIRSQHDADWGWKDNTARAIIALYLTDDLNFNSLFHEDDLEAKQLELEVSTFLLRNKSEKASTIYELATYINALEAICHNPKSFYGIDLVQELKKEIEETPNNITPFPYLTLCNAKEIFSEAVIDSLVEILIKPPDFGFALEIQSLASMTLSCISSKDQYKHLRHDVAYYLNKIKDEQNEDGSFGNVYTTALVIQALIANNQANDRDWDFNSAAEYLKTMQRVDGSFGDFLTTYLIMPALNGRSLLDVGRVNCTESKKRPREGNPVSNIKNRLCGKITVMYTLIIGDKKDQVLPLYLRTPDNITVLELMTLAADNYSKYKFKTHQIKQKTYVYEINKMPNDPEKNKFWFLYQETGNDTEPTSKQSPEEVYVGENSHIIMWYRTLTKDLISAEDYDYDADIKYLTF